MSVRNPLIGHAVSHLAVSLVRDVLHPLLATDDSDPEELNQQQRQLLQQQQQQQQQKQQQQQCTEAQQPLGQEQAEPSPAQPSPALPHKEKKSGWRVLKHLRARLNSAGIKQEILQEVMYGIGHDSEGYRYGPPCSLVCQCDGVVVAGARGGGDSAGRVRLTHTWRVRMTGKRV